MSSRDIVATLLLSLFTQHIEGFQAVVVISGIHVQDGSTNDIDYTRAVSDSNGSDTFSNICCVYGNCSCTSLHNALVNLTSNVMINITTDMKLFGSIVSLDGLANISIVGHNRPTVDCNNYGGINFTSCYNCTIEGITWERCGAISDNKSVYPALQFYNSSSVNIKSCLFQHSVGQALVLSELSGNVNINYCNFLYNTQYKDHGAAVHYSSNNLYQSGFNITIKNSKFMHNEAMSVVYLAGPTSAKSLQNFYIQHSTFNLNKAVPIYLSSQKLYICGNIEFYGNMAENGGGIFISNYSVVIFHNNAIVKFRRNTALNNGGAIYLTNHSSVFFQQNHMLYHNSNLLNNETFKAVILFNHNRANKFGKNIYAYHSYVTFGNNTVVIFNGSWEHGKSSALYIEHYSKITFEGTSEVTLTQYEYNYGAALYIHHQSEVTFKGYATVNFYDNVGLHQSGALYVHYSNATFTGNCNVIFDYNINEGALYIRNSFIRFQEYSTVMLSNNEAHDGGGMYIAKSSTIKFQGNATIKFDNNNSSNNGGAVYIEDHSTMTFEANSMVKVYNNKAGNNGGVMYVDNYSNITFEENSTAEFYKNEAQNDAGAVYITSNSAVTFTGMSTVKFNKNNATYGGVIYALDYSILAFKENSTVTFNNDKAYYGGAVFADFSTITFKGNSKVTFTNNIAYAHAGAMYITYTAVLFEGDSVVTLSNNKAYTNGGAVFISYVTIEFVENSKVSFTNNSAASGGAVYFFILELRNTTQSMRLAGNSTLSFDNNKGNEKGGAVCVDGTDPTITYENCYPLNFNHFSKVTFTNNRAFNGGAVYVGYNINIKSTESSTLTFRNNQAHIGGVIYSHTSDISFKGYSTATFNNNIALQDGGVLFSYGQCNISFIENSTATFAHNKAVNGGAMYVGEKINIKFQDNSTLTFKNNQAYNGGAIYSYASNITFQGNSTIIFINNVALQNGGALYSCTHYNISFTENPLVMFANNEATQGDITQIQFSSVIKFQGNCKITFTENKAIEYGGVIHSYVNSLVVFDGYANINFQRNKAKDGGVVSLYKSTITSRLKSNLIFENNSAEVGGAIYNSLSNITFGENSSIQFIKNTASQDGGAIYLSDHSRFILINNTKVSFFKNLASDNGKAIYVQITQSLLIFNVTKFHFSDNDLGTMRNLIYINVPKSCNKSCLFQRVIRFPENNSLPVSTSPRRLILFDPAKCTDKNYSECHTYYISNIMLGQEIRFNACVLDYYDQPTELAQFLVTGMNHQNYNMSGSKYISVSCNHITQGVSIIGNLNTLFNYSIVFSMYAAKTFRSKMISAKLIVELSQCHLGFQYSSEAQKCECYNTKNIISCSGSNSTIKRGYWFGSVDGKSTITSCPNDYCNFTCCEITNGIYHLSPIRANQCKPHRSGIACGSCEKGYTLSFDSPECMDVNKCTIGYTVLVTALSFLYWIAVIVTVFIMMHFKVAIGSLYAIIYYYSVVDIFLRQASFFSNRLYTAINILSSLAKLTPQFLGQLCLARNISGIDQQFIHYVHPIVVSLILVMISVLARRSRKVSLFVSRGIIHFICFLLLLSYTSVTTTSLLLMRSLTFTDVNKVYTYLSPDIEYFHGRHLAYVIVAMIFTIVVVISLPLLLLLEPFLNSKINFIRIKPLLDQFQGGYKDKYRYFAAYYLICRIVIIVLVMARSSDDLITHFILITVCALMALIHLVVRPYADKLYNIFDGIILQLIVILSVLPIVDFVENYDETLVAVVAYLCTILPLASFTTMKLWINRNGIQDIIKSLIIKHLHKYHTVPTDEMEIPSVNETGITTDNCERRNTTVVNM